jgi:hypothetical protein
MGRKKIDEPREPFTIMIKPSSRKEIERFAGLIELTPSRLGANLIDIALEDIQGLERLGFLKMALISVDITKRLKRKMIRDENIGIEDIQ